MFLYRKFASNSNKNNDKLKVIKTQPPRLM